MQQVQGGNPVDLASLKAEIVADFNETGDQADLRSGYAMSFRAAFWHFDAGLKSAPPAVKAFIRFPMVAMAMVSLAGSPEAGSFSSSLDSFARLSR